MIVHVIPWQIIPDGLCTFVLDLAKRTAALCPVVIIAKQAESQPPPIPNGVELRLVRSEQDALKKIQDLNPWIVHHHGPTTRWAFDGINFSRAVGTNHGYGSNINNIFDWAVPVCGDSKNVIRHGVDLKLFSFEYRETRTGKIGIIGRIHPSKQPDDFLDALENYKGALQFVFAGVPYIGPDEKATFKRIRKIRCSKTLGYLDRETELPEFYHSLDAVIVPSSTESVSYSAIEAMACGVPVVARAIDGLLETVSNAGILCQDAQAMIEAVEHISKSTIARAALAHAGRTRAETWFDLDRMIERYHRLYERLSGGLFKGAA